MAYIYEGALYSSSQLRPRGSGTAHNAELCIGHARISASSHMTSTNRHLGFKTPSLSSLRWLSFMSDQSRISNPIGRLRRRDVHCVLSRFAKGSHTAAEVPDRTEGAQRSAQKSIRKQLQSPADEA